MSVALGSDRRRVIVAGAGNAALCAALAAREAGARVCVLEAAPRGERGGNSHFTDGAIRVAYDGLDDLRALVPGLTDEQAARIDVGSYPAAEFVDDLMRTSGGAADPVLASVLATRSTGTLAWMATQGVRFELIYDNQAFEQDGRHRFWGGLVVRAEGRGVGLMAVLFARCEQLGIEVRYGSPCQALVVDRGRVRGVEVGGSGGGTRLEADAVVLACGGFEANPVLRTRHLGPDWDRAVVRGTRHNTGVGLQLALAAGAQPWGDWSGCHAIATDRGAPAAGDFSIPGDVFKKHSYPLGIVVNREGRRFVDEGADFRNYTYARYGREVLRQPGAVATQVFDGRVAPLLRSEYTHARATRVQADTLEALADRIDVDAPAFLRTVSQFNAAVQPGRFRPHELDGKGTAGIDPPKSNWAQTIDTPPFLAFPVTCGITFTFGGVRVDERAAVLHTDGRPIPGLFAAGEMVGGLFHGNYPGGAGLASGAVFGRIAGRSAAGE